MAEKLEETQIELRATICTLDEASLRELCAELQIELKEETGRLALIQRITKYLDVEELNVEKLQKLKEAIADKKKPPTKIKSEKETGQEPGFHEASVSTPKGSTTIPSFKKEFKISGQIGDSRQKDRLSFTSLAHQINAGLDRGHQEKEVTEAVIRAINPGLRLRSYLEGKPDLTLATLRKILRSHYQEKGATEMYQLLSSGAQEGGETPQEFLVRLLDLKQKVLFASQEAGSNLKYDPKLVHCMFLHSLLTGLRSDSIKLEVKPYLQNAEVTDEELFEKLNVAVSNEMERWQKLGTRREEPTRQGLVQQVAQLPSSSKNQSSAEGKTLEKPVKVDLLAEVRAMKAELAAIRETMGNQRNTGPNQYRFVEWERARPRGCLKCQREGVEYRCDHCYKCGKQGHFSYHCAQPWVQRSENLQGNGRGSLPRDREQPRRLRDGPNNV